MHTADNRQSVCGILQGRPGSSGRCGPPGLALPPARLPGIQWEPAAPAPAAAAAGALHPNRAAHAQCERHRVGAPPAVRSTAILLAPEAAAASCDSWRYRSLSISSFRATGSGSHKSSGWPTATMGAANCAVQGCCVGAGAGAGAANCLRRLQHAVPQFGCPRRSQRGQGGCSPASTSATADGVPHPNQVPQVSEVHLLRAVLAGLAAA